MSRIVKKVIFAIVACLAFAGQLVSLAIGSNIALSFGSNNTGRTGLGTIAGNTLVATPILSGSLADPTITQMSGGAYSLLMTSDGTAYSFGSNTGGATGQGTEDFLSYYDVPTPIITTNFAGKKIVQVDAGSNHSLFLTDDGSVFASGSNGLAGGSLLDGNILVATPIDTTYLSGKRIKQVAAGTYHSLLLAEDGSVYSFGGNTNGQIGVPIGTDTQLARPINAANLGGKKIKQVAAGHLHSLILAEDGTVYSFGSNGDGRTGLNTVNGNTAAATAINTTNLGGRKIAQVAAGQYHSLLLAEDGSVFSFGWNADGVTGLGINNFTTTNVAKPILTTNLGGKTITEVVTGFYHSLLLASDGTVFSFGSNSNGQTGMNTDVGVTAVATPISTMNLAGLRVTNIVAGEIHSLLLAVPEPGTHLLAGMALIAIAARTRRWSVQALRSQVF